LSLFIGTTFLEFGELPSTNTYATDLLSKTKPNEGTVVMAQRQTAGRGQLGSKWAAEPNQNLTFSLILYPTFVPPAAQFLFNQAIALGIFEAVSTCLRVYLPKGSHKVAIKWSNDILINDKKVCGVLIENSLSANKITSSVVGIGINLNQTDFEGLPNATSLAAIIGAPIDAIAFREMLFDALEARYLQLRAGRIAELQSAYLKYLYRYGEDACYQITATEQIIFARMLGVTAAGRLELLTQNGVETFATKEIRFL
jgi:BirA family transcriptional regulator, biotin operon repressor / biotin---[acetyl-CoA-carboxylase] ligase